MKKDARLLLKSEAIPPGARWITVHPNDGPGQPVLIEPQPDGSAKVIGGAGGSLNHLRLRGVKSVSEYRQEASEKAADKRKAHKDRVAAEKATGVYEAKQKAREEIKTQKRDAERKVIEAVAKKAGWNEQDLEFPEDDYSHLSEEAQGKLRAQHHAKLLSRAKEFIAQAREKLVTDAAARHEAGIGEIPLFSEKPEDLSVEDLDPAKKQVAGLGFNPDYGKRAEDAGLTPEALQEEAMQVKLASMTPEQRQAYLARGQAPNLIKQELAGIKEPAAPSADASLLSAQDALELVKEGKRLAEIEKKARAANAELDNGPAEPKAFVLESSDDAHLDQAAKDAVLNDLRTAQTVAFLSEVGKIAGAKPNETLGGHIGVGAYNSINALALAVGGDALVDRSVVDVLGIAGAAQVLARRLHTDLSPEEARHVAEGIQDWHLNHYMQTSTDALKKARDLTDAAAAIEPDAGAGTGMDLAAAQELNSRRRAAVGDAQRILGQALGEMEANAALVMAMKQGAANHIEVSLGKVSPESAIKQIRAIGLLPGDYTLDRVAGDTFLKVNSSGMDRIAKPVNREDVQQVRRNLAIIRGDRDEDGWLPLGVANRPDLVMDVKPGVVEHAEAGDPAVDSQKFSVDQKSVEALHRALSAHPEGVAAYKQIGELSNRDQMALRNHYSEASATPWKDFVKEMGGAANAYTAVQDMVRSKVSEEFAAAHNKLHPENPIKLGKCQIRGGLDYQAITGGDATRNTLGSEAENQIAGMMSIVGQNFKPGQPTKLWSISMSGKYVAQQRAIKLIDANKRVVLDAGAGSGKTNMMLGAHAHLASQGKIKRLIMLVPSIVQGQFNGEALRLLEPGKFKAHIQPGASREERIAAYKDPETHIAVMTHQSFRDDMIHLGAQHEGIDEGAMADRLQAMNPEERQQWISGVMEKEGIHFDASFVDEAHDTLNRAGKENSGLANVVEALGHHTPYHVYASGDPVKNDPSEIHSMLQKMDPKRYADRAEFMRRYGADTISSKQALQREMARYVFPTSITPDVERKRIESKVQLTGGQKQALDELTGNLAKARKAQRLGKLDVEAAKAISPSSFEGVPESEHEAIAAGIQKSLGIIKSSAIGNIINNHPENAKVQEAVKHVQEREGRQGVIFSRNRASVELYRKAMEKIGKRVVVITGSDGPKEKDAKRRLFNPEKGEPQADILIASDAGAVGMNLQSGSYLIQHDVSATAKTHSQRNARIDRIGQKQGIELIDMVADHPEEAKSRQRLMKKYALKDMMASPLDGLDDTGVAGAIAARRAAAQDVQGANV